MSRQPMPDLMADLMNGNNVIVDCEQENHKAIKQANNIDSGQKETTNARSKKLGNNKTIKLPKNKAIKQDNGMEIFETKEKATFNLSLSTLEALEDAWIKLKRQFKGEQRITKTAIVEMALEICMDEFKKKGSDSILHKRLADS